MSKSMLVVCLGLIVSASSNALGQGVLLPVDQKIPPLEITYQRVNVTIKEQAAVTRVEQEFQNDSSSPLEAFYIFPVPKGAGVDDFAMWIDGKRTTGEVVEAKQARKIYEDVVRRLKDPGLLEHMGDNLYRVRVFPVPAKGKQKIEISFSQIVPRDAGIAEYTYPLKVCGSDRQTKQDFTVRVELESSAPLKSVYSPSHDVGVSRDGEHRAVVGFEANRYDLDRDFQLFWTVSEKDVGLSFLANRESPGEKGYFLALISPSTDLDPKDRVPRDVVFVIDTSGSMQGEKMEQAKRALQFCIKSLSPKDRFAILGFATTITLFDEKLQPAESDTMEKAVKWAGALQSNGGTAIHDALEKSLSLRTDDNRNFTVVFLTDGQPTIGETSMPAIVKMVKAKNTSETRVFVFGVGDDVNTHLLDQIAEETRATSVYVRPKEDLEVKVSSFYGKISHPVMTELKLAVGSEEIKLDDIYPPKLPDLFHGSQLVVLGRYSGSGATSIKLSGKVGSDAKEFVHDASFPEEKRENEFLGDLWARRKVGYLLDQIRLHGENKELVDEVTALAKKHGIATPYTSYLVIPDQVHIAQGGFGGTGGGIGGGGIRPANAPARQMRPDVRIAGNEKRESLGIQGLQLHDRGRNEADNYFARRSSPAAAAPAEPGLADQSGEKAVEIAQVLADMKSSSGGSNQGSRRLAGTSFVPRHGVWIDAAYKEGSATVSIVYLSEAYFRLIDLVPQAKDVLALGERIVWHTPSGKTLIIDSEGKDSMTDAEIEALFQSK